MPKYLDITDKQYGRTTAKRFVGRDGQGKALWECECNCGMTHITKLESLQSGGTQSCGCYHADEIRDRTKPEDLSGQDFGRWHVLMLARRGKTGRSARWVCRCKCGDIYIVQAPSLKGGGSTQCNACAAKERCRKKQKQPPVTELKEK